MKKIIYGSLCLAFTGIGLLACKKETIAPKNVSLTTDTEISDQKDKNENDQNNKSLGQNNDIESMAKAANLSRIFYIPNGDKFLVNAYDDNKTYRVKVQDFNVGNLVKFVISEGPNNHQVEINFNSQDITIDGIGSFTFDNYYEDNTLTPESGKIKNITAVFASYYASIGKASTQWVNNGGNDVYLPGRKFIGTTVVKGPCDDILHLQNVTTTTFFFWLNLGSSSELRPC